MDDIGGIQPVINEKKKRCQDFKKGNDGLIALCY